MVPSFYVRNQTTKYTLACMPHKRAEVPLSIGKDILLCEYMLKGITINSTTSSKYPHEIATPAIWRKRPGPAKKNAIVPR